MKILIHPNHYFQIEEIPNDCPYCHKKINPEPLIGFENRTADNFDKKYINEFIIAFKCTNANCFRTIITAYKRLATGKSLFKGCLNGYPESNIPEEVQKISPKFQSIYIQSRKAEDLGLNEIDGNGYRKAIEFLARDYAIYRNPEKKEPIAKAALANVIDQYYDDDVKELFHRGTWLGSDHVHYKQYYNDYNLNDLKGIIEIIMAEIVREETKRKYLAITRSK